MLSFSGSLKVLVALEPCDLRKGFNGLHALVTERLAEDPQSGTLFVFCNRDRTRLKILCWDGTGLWLLTKRLERGTFSWPKTVEAGTTKLKLTPQALALEIKVAAHTQRPRIKETDPVDAYVLDVTFSRDALKNFVPGQNLAAFFASLGSRFDVRADGGLNRIDPPSWLKHEDYQHLQ